MGSFVNEEDENVTYLANFIKSIEPLFAENETFDGLEEALLNLEMTDENFHRHDFVRRIRERISTQMGDLIDEIAKDKRLLHDEKLITTVVSHLLKKDSYANLVTDVLKGLAISSKTVKKDIENDELQFSPLASVRTGNQFIYGPHSIGDDSFTSSFDAGATFMFMSIEKYETIAAKLLAVDQPNSRVEALTVLNQIPQADIVSSEIWPRIKQGLHTALIDDSDAIVMVALQFYGRAVATSSAVVAKELYTSFVEHLVDCFSDNTNHMVVLQSGIDLGDKRNTTYIRKFALLNQFQRELTVCWIRYPEKVIESIIDCTVKLLGVVLQPVSPMADAVMLPLQFLALVDPEAIWFKRWMHGHYSRNILLSLLEKHHNLVTSAVLTCFECLTTYCFTGKSESKSTINESDDNDALICTRDEIAIACTLHSFHFLGHLFSYKNGRALFPLQLEEPNGVVTLDDVVVALIQIACSEAAKQTNKTADTVPLGHLPIIHSSMIVVRLATESAETCARCICSPAVVTAMQTILAQLQGGVESITPHNANTLEMIAKVLGAVSRFPSGRLQLLYTDRLIRWQRSQNSFATIIVKFICSNIDKVHRDQILASVITSYLSICHQIYNTCEGLYAVLIDELPLSISRALVKLGQRLKTFLGSGPKRGNSSNKPALLIVEEIILPYITQEESVLTKFKNTEGWESFEADLKTYLACLDSLLTFSATPKGVLLLQLSGMMETCVYYMSAKYKLQSENNQTEKYRHGMVVNQLAVTPAGAVALNKTGIFQSFLDEIYLLLEGNSIHENALHLETISHDLSCKSSRRLLVAMVAYFGCFDSMSEYFETEVESAVDRPSKFSCLSNFISQCFNLNTSASNVGATQFELRHAFALTVLNSLVTCLDTLLFLQERFRMTESVVKLQLTSRLEGGAFIVDACTLLRNEYLVRSSILGGPEERVLPPSTLIQDESGHYPWPLFAGFPIPSVYACVSHSKESSSSNQTLSFDHLTGGESLSKELLAYLDGGGQLTTTAAAALLNQADFHCPSVDLSLPSIQYDDTKLTSKTKTSDISSQAVSMIVNYGLRLGLLKPPQCNQEESLKSYLITLTDAIQKQQTHSADTEIRHHRGSSTGFDWFACVVYLFQMGDTHKALQFLHRVSGHMVSAYIWLPRLHDSIYIENPSLRFSGVSLLHSKVLHNIELILQTEMPEMVSAFQLSASSSSQVAALWLRQCFINYLNWKQIEIFILLCCVCGTDYQVYCCLAVLKHLQRDILAHAQQRDLLMFLRQKPIVDFSFQHYVSFMKEMQAKYRAIVLEDMTDLSRA